MNHKVFHRILCFSLGINLACASVQPQTAEAKRAADIWQAACSFCHGIDGTPPEAWAGKGMRKFGTLGMKMGFFFGGDKMRAGIAKTIAEAQADRAPTQRFVDHFRPDLGVLMETEIWPNLIAACRARDVPLALVNARLSARSLRGAERVGWLLRPAYGALSAAYAQTEADAARRKMLSLGIDTLLVMRKGGKP